MALRPVSGVGNEAHSCASVPGEKCRINRRPSHNPEVDVGKHYRYVSCQFSVDGRSNRHRDMWTPVLLAGIILFVVGRMKWETDWGKPVAILGAVGVGVSLVVVGPDLLDSFLRGFNDGYNPDVPADTTGA